MLVLTTSQVAALNGAAEAIEEALGAPVEVLSFEVVNWQVTRVAPSGGWRVTRRESAPCLAHVEVPGQVCPACGF